MSNYSTREYQTLESEKYWLPIKNRDSRLVRKLRRRQTVARFLMFCFFAVGATVGYLYCTGELEYVDMVGAVERARTWLNV